MEPGRDLNARVAVEVMGWKPIDRKAAGWGDGPEVWATGDDSEDGSPTRQWFEPSTDIAAAWKVVEKLGLAFELGWLPTDEGLSWDASFGEKRGSEEGTTTYAATAPLAICLAALKAVATQRNTERSTT